MELIALVKEGFQTVAEHAASYRIGQSALRFLDRSLWVVEKCARWAVPPPLDQDERPQPELVRPLPWVFFLMMLVTLRVTRESISLINLIMGKPPLRSVDVVMYIQSKRRYLRTLKYQGNRILRARTSGTQYTQSWSQALHSLFEFTMCFRRQSSHYGNNNTTSVSNNDEVLVVKRSKRGREPSSPAASTSETTMERLIEKMLVGLDADSDDDSSFTLTNVTSVKSDRSDFTIDSDQDVPNHNNTSEKNDINSPPQQTLEDASDNQRTENTPNKSEMKPNENMPNIPKTQHPRNASSTPVKQHSENALTTPKRQNSGKALSTADKQHTGNIQCKVNNDTWNTPKFSSTSDSQHASITIISHETSCIENSQNTLDGTYSDLQEVPRSSSTPDKSRLAVFLDNERTSTDVIPKEEQKKSPETSPSKIPRTPVVEQKIANGRTVKRVPSKKKGTKSMDKDKRNSEVHVEMGGNSTL